MIFFYISWRCGFKTTEFKQLSTAAQPAAYTAEPCLGAFSPGDGVRLLLLTSNTCRLSSLEPHRGHAQFELFVPCWGSRLVLVPLACTPAHLQHITLHCSSKLPPNFMLMSTPVLCNVRQGSPIAQQAPLPGLSSAYHEIAQAAQNNGLGEMAQTTGFDHDGAISAEQKVQGEVDPVLLSDEQLKDNMRKVPPSDLYKEDLTQKELCAVITKLRGHSVRFPKEGKFLRFLNAAVCDKELRKRKEKGANFLKVCIRVRTSPSSSSC